MTQESKPSSPSAKYGSITPICIISLKRNAGKTTLITKLIKELNEKGYTVNVIKHIHKNFDTPQKDTWRIINEGANTCTAITPQQTVIIIPKQQSIEEIQTMLPPADITLMEGFKKSKYPKIAIIQHPEEAQKITNYPNVIAIISKEKIKNLNIRQYDPSQIQEITNLVIETAKPKEMKPIVQLVIDGRLIPMNPFVRRMLQNIIQAFIDCLHKIPEEKNKIMIRIEK